MRWTQRYFSRARKRSSYSDCQHGRSPRRERSFYKKCIYTEHVRYHRGLRGEVLSQRERSFAGQLITTICMLPLGLFYALHLIQTNLIQFN